MKKILTTMLISVFVVGCGSAQKENVVVKDNGREFKKDYDLVEASSAKFPRWVDKPSRGDSSKLRKANRYFVSESANSNKRLCLRSAQARATARISAEIAQFIKNTYSEATQNGEDDASEYMQEQLAQEAQSFVIGAKVLKTYWERRSYKESLGAEENKSEFNCYALVKMDKKDLAKAISRSKSKLLGELEDPEVKQKAEKILEDVSKKFTELDEKVDVQEEEA